MQESATNINLNRVDLLRLLAVLSVVIYLVPEGAHFFAMFSKMRLAPNDYMTVQRIYDGWALFGIVMVLALACTLGLAIVAWRTPLARWLALASFASLLANQAIFWSLIFPVNALTRNWTVMPDNLDAVRRQWEYAHAANAGVMLVALVLVLCAVLADVRGRS